MVQFSAPLPSRRAVAVERRPIASLSPLPLRGSPAPVDQGMAQIPTEVLERYDEVPIESYNSQIPFCVRFFPDDEVMPAGDFTLSTATGGQAKWIKVSRYDLFKKACRAYWVSCLATETNHPLHVFVMPYLPLDDAYLLHQLIENPDILPEKFDEAAGHLQGKASKGEMVGQEPGDGKMEILDEEPLVEEKTGVLQIDNTGDKLSFMVVNYSALWAKAEKHCLLVFLTDPLHEFLKRVSICDKVLGDLPPGGPARAAQLADAVDDARRELIFATCAAYGDGALGANPHGAIMSMYPDLHDDIYLQCHHCHPHQYPPEQEDTPEILYALEDAMNMLGFADYEGGMTVEQAQLRLLVAEGQLEYYGFNSAALQDFSIGRLNFKEIINHIFERLRDALQRQTLIGVVSVLEEGNDDMDIYSDEELT